MHECEYCWARGICRTHHDQGALNKHIGGSKQCREARKAAAANELRIQLGVTLNDEQPRPSSPEDSDVDMLDTDVDPMLIREPIPGLAPELDPHPPAENGAHDAPEDIPEVQAVPRSSGRRATGNQRYVHIEEVPDEDAPQPGMTFGATSTRFEDVQESQEQNDESQYGPFLNKEVWEVAEFMVDCLGKSEADRFLKLPRVRKGADLSFENAGQFYDAIDKLPSPHAPLKCKRVQLVRDKLDRNGKPRIEHLELWYRNIVEVVWELIGNPEYQHVMAYKPERVFRDILGLKRIFDQGWTADWWHETQKKLPRHATIASISIFTDETHLTNFSGGKKAHPVYATINNIEKSFRRKISSGCHVLIGYLPVPKSSRKSGEGRKEKDGFRPK